MKGEQYERKVRMETKRKENKKERRLNKRKLSREITCR